MYLLRSYIDLHTHLRIYNTYRNLQFCSRVRPDPVGILGLICVAVDRCLKDSNK